jgi:hypothetical protein
MSTGLRWAHRHPPLVPRGIVVFGSRTTALHDCIRTAIRQGATWALDRGEWGPEGGQSQSFLVARCLSNHQLPWLDGATYFGADGALPGLFLPTARRPIAPEELLLAALRGPYPQQGEILLLEEPTLCLHLAPPWPVSGEEDLHGYR